MADFTKLNGYDVKDAVAREQIEDIKTISNYYDEITYSKERNYDTDCYIVEIPKLDNNGNQITPYIAYSQKSPLEKAQEDHTTLTINASLSIITPTITSFTIPIIIGNGNVLNDTNIFINSDLADNYVYLGIDANRNFKEYKVNETTAQEMLEDGCLQVFDAYYKLVENGASTDLTDVVTNRAGVVTTPNPRQCIGVKNDGTIIILTCDARTGNDIGLTSAQTQEILIEKGCVNAWNLDGGGSASTSYKESKLNRNIDSDRTTERKIPYTLNFKKTILNEELAKAFSKIGEEKQNIIQQILPMVVQDKAKGLDDADLNTLTKEIVIGYGNNMLNKPIADRNGYFVNIPHSNTQYIGLYAKQFWFERDYSRIYMRNLINGVFTTWRPIDPLHMNLRSGSAQIITADDTYEKLNISNATVGVNNELITINDDDTFSFGTNGFGYAKISIDLTFNGTTVTTGNKYISLERNGVQQQGFVWRFKAENDGYDSSTHIEWGFPIQPNESTTDDKYAILVYGKAGDRVERRSVNIEVI